MDHPGTGSAVPAAAQRPQHRPDAPLDGNALAGPLGLVFTGDLTVASVVCAGCGRSELLAALPVVTGVTLLRDGGALLILSPEELARWA